MITIRRTILQRPCANPHLLKFRHKGVRGEVNLPCQGFIVALPIYLSLKTIICYQIPLRHVIFLSNPPSYRMYQSCKPLR